MFFFEGRSRKARKSGSPKERETGSRKDSSTESKDSSRLSVFLAFGLSSQKSAACQNGEGVRR